LKNILFDLGGVILDLNVNATLEGFLDMGFPKELLEYPQNIYTDVFYLYETGQITTEVFRNTIREITKQNFSNEEFDAAWCGMLVGVPFRRIEILKDLAEKYSLYMLSNTSPMHIEYFEKMFGQTAGFALEDVFTKLYYSYEIGKHKPDAGAFIHVLEDAGIEASETLFLDDNIQNVKAAEELGFQVIHINETRTMESLGFGL